MLLYVNTYWKRSGFIEGCCLHIAYQYRHQLPTQTHYMPEQSSSRKAAERFHGRVRHSDGRVCRWYGCALAGEFKAPAPTGGMDWYCLDHIRDFNAGYDYFKGLGRAEIEALQSHGHPSWTDLPAWPFAAKAAQNLNISDPFGLFQASARGPSAKPLDPKTTKAFSTLGLPPCKDRAPIRRAYKTLVRRFHPDMNGGNRAHEGDLLKVIDAYTHLLSYIAQK